MQDDFSNKYPEPIYDDFPFLVVLYHKGWEALASRIRTNPDWPAQKFIDTRAADGSGRRIYDACFAAMACKYALDSFPGLETLTNYYAAMFGDSKPKDFNFVQVPSQPLLPWAEYECALFSGDMEHVRSLLQSGILQRQYEVFEKLESVPLGKHLSASVARRMRGYIWSEDASGMVDSGRELQNCSDKLFWVDLLGQQCLAALCISRLAALVCDTTMSAKWRGKFAGKKTLLMRWYWNSESGFFHDLNAVSLKQTPLQTCAGYWGFVSCCPDLMETDMATKLACLPERYGGKYPFPTVPHDSPIYDPDAGSGWRGCIRSPEAYALMRGLLHNNWREEVRPLCIAHLRQVAETLALVKPHAFWTAYSPTSSKPALPKEGHPGEPARPDVSCASCVAPICMFIEGVLGFRYIDSFRRLVEWNPPTTRNRVGIKGLRFGGNQVDLVCEGPRCFIRAAKPFTLQLDGVRYDIGAGPVVLRRDV